MSERESERARACVRRVIYGKINYGAWRNTVMFLGLVILSFFTSFLFRINRI